ncbi:MAG: hypothetical protein SFV15_11960 [Polyangiaceae bacterium]|nr:hypothetical protein [Polyangiaceae bacterium]
MKAYPECSREPTDGDVQAAKGAFQAGQAAFKEADYARAILYWEDAYRRDCTAHPLLLNLATAYELSGNKEQAIAALQTYLVRRSDAPDADQITRRVEVLKRQVEEAKAAAQPAPAPVQPPPPAAPPKPPEGEIQTQESSGNRPILPLIVAGSGGAIAFVGVAVWARAGADIKDLEKQCPTRSNCPKQVADDGNAARRRQTIGGVTTIAGLVIAAGGTAWYFLSPSEPESVAGSHFTPVVVPGYAGFTLSSRF